MATEIIMPKLGMSMVEGTVVAWKKKIGDPVKKGEGVVDISSEKIEAEVEAPAEGTLLEITVAEGEAVPYGTVIGYIGLSGEMVPKDAVTIAAATAKEEAATAAAGVTVAEPKPASAVPSQNELKISPVARKIAEKAGLALELIAGTGPGGRITKEDVEKALADRDNEEPERSVKPVDQSEAAVAQNSVEQTPVTGMRKVIATRMFESLQQSAQLTLTMQADVTDLLALQRQIADDVYKRYENKLTVTDFIARATVLALMRHKQMNSAFLADRIETYGHVHLGIAVALEKGLVVPVIAHAEKASLIELSKAIKSLGQRARNNQLDSNEMKGSTFTITNLGGYGVEYFTPVLNPPEAGILGVGAIKELPVYKGADIIRASLLPLSLTFDHRVLDGAPAAEFLATIKRYLEEPYSLLL